MESSGFDLLAKRFNDLIDLVQASFDHIETRLKEIENRLNKIENG